MNSNNLRNQLTNEELLLVNSEVSTNKKNVVLAWLLWWFLGCVGGHRYYFGRTGSAIAMTLIVVLTFGIGIIVTGIWMLVDAFSINSWLKADQEKIENEAIQEIIMRKDDNNKSNATPPTDVSDSIKKYKALLDDGAISEEEFNDKKKELLDL
ncbi:NINE protein [Dellaglioa sp. P0083]|uniref:NINE protein n=1 Tax=Dellaglioa kimchii TaxID=3344667 RepID=UPI0038D4595B